MYFNTFILSILILFLFASKPIACGEFENTEKAFFKILKNNCFLEDGTTFHVSFFQVDPENDRLEDVMVEVAVGSKKSDDWTYAAKVSANEEHIVRKLMSENVTTVTKVVVELLYFQYEYDLRFYCSLGDPIVSSKSKTPKDHRKILGISKENPTKEEITKAYRQKSQEVHPDKHPTATHDGKNRWGEKFNEVKEAYDALMKQAK